MSALRPLVAAVPGGLALRAVWQYRGFVAGLVQHVNDLQREPGRLGYSFRYSRRRRVCIRLTGISVALSSFIFRM